MPRSAASGLPPLLPSPRHARRLQGSLRLRDDLPVVLAPGSDRVDLGSARALADGLRARCGLALPIETHARCADLGPHIELARGADAGDGYQLQVRPNRASVRGTGPAGLRYGVETLLQLVTDQGRVPACSIDDEPDLAMRGIMLDISRGKVPTLETLRELVDLCVRLKLNMLMLYTEHVFRFRRHPSIGAGASPLDARTIRELDAYAADRHVELVPTLQSLGHMRRVLTLPRYRMLAETDRLWSLSPAEPGTYTLLRDLYEEYLPNFRSRLFNANCDEPYDLGRGKSARRAAQLGPGGVFLEHVRRVRDMAGELGKRTMIWADVVHAHPERIGEIDDDLVLLDWWYEANHDFDRVKIFADNGLDFLVCPGTSSWNCLFPRLENSLINISRTAAAGKRHGALGLINTDWGDGGHYNLQGNSWFAFGWGAQQAWSGDLRPEAFDRAFSRLLFGDASGEVARLYRALGAVHDAGFPVPNGSALQLLYFDDVQPARFVVGGRKAKLRRAEKQLERIRERIAAARSRFGSDEPTHAELLLAADASWVAARKGLAGLEYLAWRRRPGTLNARARRSLARRFSKLADEQAALGRRLRQLWRRRSQISDFEHTRRRLARSVRSMRRAAASLERGRPLPGAPPARYDPKALLEALAEWL